MLEGSAGPGAVQSLVQGSGLRWIGADKGGGGRSMVEGSDRRWRRSDRWWRRAIDGGGEVIAGAMERWMVEGIAGPGAVQSLVEGSGLRWIQADKGGGERSKVEGSDR